MPDYTLINLDQLEDMAAKSGRKGYQARFATKSLQLRESGLGYQKLNPNFRLSFGHKHEEQEEVFVVLSGGGRANLEGKTVELSEHDALRVPKEVMRGFEAGPEGMELLIFSAPHTTANDAILEHGWWA